jgi:hypothetical protein
LTTQRWACGFTEVVGADETVEDYLFEVFALQEGKGPDGLIQLEGVASLFCMCRAGGSVADMDEHFLTVFTPADGIGRDGDKHQRLVA